MKLTVNILDDFIQTLPLSGLVLCFDNVNNTTIVRVPNIYYLRAKLSVILDGISYEVIAVNHDKNTFTVNGTLSPTTYLIPAPFYFHGTPTATSNHISKLKNNEKYPFIFLPEILTEEEQNIDSSIERITSLRLIFLDNSNYRDWSTDDHYSKVLIGLNKLVDLFIETFQADRKTFFSDETTFTRVNHVKWGNFAGNRHNQSIFNEHLSGVELQFTANIKTVCQQENRKPLCSNQLTEASENYIQQSRLLQWQF